MKVGRWEDRKVRRWGVRELNELNGPNDLNEPNHLNEPNDLNHLNHLNEPNDPYGDIDDRKRYTQTIS
jgi:hypothetical protein